MLFLLIILGSAIFVSNAVLEIRRRAFRTKLEDLAKLRQSHLQPTRSFSFSRSRRRASRSDNASGAGSGRGDAITPHRDAFEESNNPQSTNKAEASLDERMAFRSSPHVESIYSETRTRPTTGHIEFDEETRSNRRESSSPPPRLRRVHSKLITGSGVGVHAPENHPRNARPVPANAVDEDTSTAGDESHPRKHAFKRLEKYVQTVNGHVGRNSAFHNLTEQERRRLGCIEYDAICYLSWIVPTYFILWQLLGVLGVGAWMRNHRANVALENGQKSQAWFSVAQAYKGPGLNPFWTGAFFAISAFNNSGMAILDANAVVFQLNYYPLLTLSLLILAGNTCFPPFLRLIIWTLRNCIPASTISTVWQTRRRILDFILDHPRRVYTHLFPSPQTWWLVGTLVLLNGVDWVGFELLNIGNETIDSISLKYRVLDGLFQAFAVRCGGFYVVNIAGLRPGLLVLYALMMYVSAYPVTMTIRNTNVYEERSLGIFADAEPGPLSQPPDSENEKVTFAKLSKPVRVLTNNLKRMITHEHLAGTPSQGLGQRWSRQDFVRQQLRGQLGHDLWWLAIAVLLITCIETGQFERDPVTFSTFNIIFEVISAYGTVGISMGLPWSSVSFCGAWHTASKLILCAVMLRGRHRGLPVAIDKAVLLPDETLGWAEEEDALQRKGEMRSASRGRMPARRSTELQDIPRTPTSQTGADPPV